ncbi:helix-turn-helix domain-containing protein [Chloroflexota bacterium]
MTTYDSEKKTVLTPEEARKKLGIGRGLMYESIRRGTIPHLRIGRKILIPVHSLQMLLENAGRSRE